MDSKKGSKILDSRNFQFLGRVNTIHFFCQFFKLTCKKSGGCKRAWWVQYGESIEAFNFTISNNITFPSSSNKKQQECWMRLSPWFLSWTLFIPCHLMTIKSVTLQDPHCYITYLYQLMMIPRATTKLMKRNTKIDLMLWSKMDVMRLLDFSMASAPEEQVPDRAMLAAYRHSWNFHFSWVRRKIYILMGVAGWNTSCNTWKNLKTKIWHR